MTAAAESVTMIPGGIERLAVCIGAKVAGVGLGGGVSSGSRFAEIKGLLLQHRVLFPRDQAISGKGHVAFVRRFGKTGRTSSSGL